MLVGFAAMLVAEAVARTANAAILMRFITIPLCSSIVSGVRTGSVTLVAYYTQPPQIGCYLKMNYVFICNSSEFARYFYFNYLNNIDFMES